jgi:IS30 family transposase
MMAGKRLFDILEDELRRLYLEEKLSMEAIAKRYGCSMGTVRNELVRKGIRPRTPAEAAALKSIRIPKEQLEKMYVEQQMSGPEIAKALGCDPGVIYRELRRHGIPRRSKEEITRLSRAKTAIRDKIDEGILWEMYYKRRLSKNQIAKALGYSASTISRRMKDLNMESRSLSEALRISRRDLRIEIPKEVLRELYVKRVLSTEEIGEILGCSPNTVYRRLQGHGIKVRSTAKAAVRYPQIRL